MKKLAHPLTISRRASLIGMAALMTSSRSALAATPREVTWDDLIPPGVAYAEIIGPGEIDEINDFWRPEYDKNATRLNADLDGAYITMPGYVLPLVFGSEGVTEFILVPYIGACIHVPPPPANQLVFVTAETPWPSEQMWDAVWVTGQMRTQLLRTEVADIGYDLTAEYIELYKW